MLPTLGFVLTAYLLYALLRVWSRHYRRQFQPYRRYRAKRHLGLLGGTGIGLGIVILLSIIGIPADYENLRTASIIPASWGQDPMTPAQAMQRQEILPLKSTIEQGQPVYAYLHPETPAPQLLPDKNGPGHRRLHKPTMRKPAPRAKAVNKLVTKAPKKEKAPAKALSKRKKPLAPKGTLVANSG